MSKSTKAVEPETTGDPTAKTAEQLYDAFVAERRVYQAQPAFADLTPGERAQWEAVAAEANK